MDNKPDFEKYFAYGAAIIFLVVVVLAVIAGVYVITQPMVETGIQSNIVTNL